MNEPEPQSAVPKPKLHWFRLAPGRLILALLAAEALLWLSERFGWLPWHKGYAVLMAVATVGAVLVLLLLWHLAALIFRLRFQYSLQTLMLFALLCAIPCSWLATQLQTVRKQKEAVAKVRALGGSVVYDFLITQQHAISGGWKPPTDVRGTVFEDELHDGWVYFNPDKSRCPDWAYRWFGVDCFHTVTGVTLDRKAIGDDDLECLRNLSDIEYLSVGGDSITDCAIAYVKNLRALKELRLQGTRVGDEGMAQLVDLPRLEVLDVDMTRVTDAAIPHISRMRSLTELNANSGVHDANSSGAFQAHPLSRSMTLGGLCEIHDAIPNCYICTHFCDDDCMDIKPERN
jgi:hypothetical protein